MRSHVRREGVNSRLLAPPALLLHDRPRGPSLLRHRRRLFLDGDDGGDHVSNGGTCSMLVDGESAT